MPSHRGGSVYSDDAYSSASQWTTTYRKIPKKQPMSIRFLSWAAGAPRGATFVKKRTRDSDDRSTRSGGSSSSLFSDQDTQLYWVTDYRYDYSGSSSGSSSGRSRSGRKSSRGKHFNGAFPPPHMPPPGPGFDGPMDGHFVPPPIHMGGPHGGGFNPPPPPPPMGVPMGGPPMGPPMGGGGDPGFIDLTGQNHQAFDRMGAPGGHHHHQNMHASSEDYYSESSDSESSYHE